MGHRRPLLLCLVVLLSIPAAALGQAFPPPEEAAKLSKGEPPREVGPILAVGLGWGGGTTLDPGKGTDYMSMFKAGKRIHGLAGLRIQSFGMAGIYHTGTPGVANKACPGGGCTGSGKQVGGLLMMVVGAGVPGPVFDIGIGYWTDRTEITRNGVVLQRLDGWALFEYASFEVPVGRPTSPFRLGGYFILAMTSYDKVTTPAGVASVPVTAGTPIWGELGLRASFF